MQIQLSHILIAVVYLATCYHSSISYHSPRTRRHTGNVTMDISSDWGSDSEETSSEIANRWLSHRESQLLLRREGGDDGLAVDCCPSTLEMIEPEGGRNRDGLLVQLFSAPNSKQSFFEVSCRTGVENKPCRFMDRHLHNQSRCIQKYSYTYAIVREPEKDGENNTVNRSHPFNPFPSGGSNWMLDYIRVRSGCTCVVYPRAKKRRSKNKRGKD